MTTSRIMKSVNSNNKVIWFVVVLSLAIVTGIAIADGKWLYLGIALGPLIIYLCILKPFIFPVGMYVLLIPFDPILALFGSTGCTTLTKLLGILSILVLSIKGAHENKLNKPDATSILWLLFIVYGFSSVWWAIVPRIPLATSTTVTGLILLYLVVAHYQLRKSEFEILKWCIFVGGSLVSLFAIYSYKTIQNLQRSEVVSFGDHSTGTSKLAFALLIPISISVGMMIKENNKFMKVLFGTVLGTMIFSIIITGSRGGSLGLAAIFVSYILFSKRRITFMTILIVIGIVIMSFVPDLFIKRWGNLSSGSGRLDIWYVGCLLLEKYWPIGAGMNCFNTAYDEFAYYAPTFVGMHRGPHNIYLKYFVELGVVGFTILILAITRHYKTIQSQFTQYNIDTVMLKAAFWAIMISSFFRSTFQDKSFWLLWMMIIMYKNISRSSNEFDSSIKNVSKEL